jgi:multiple sugar transport system substrate-binding protein
MGESIVRHVTKLLAGVAFAAAVLPGAASAEDKTITAIFCGDKMQPVHAEYIKQWEAKNAGFKVAPEVVGWDQCQDKATTLAAAGTPVGLAYVGSRTLKQFATNDLIVPIEYTEDEEDLLPLYHRYGDNRREAVGRSGRLLDQVALLEQGSVQGRRPRP